jgi:hypothetical protein
MARDPELRIAGDRVHALQGRKTLFESPLAEFLDRLARRGERSPACALLPRGLRMLVERGDAAGVALEVPAHARTVRWIADDSPASFGADARYEECFLAFPYVVLLVVFQGGALTGFQQLYYRTRPLRIGGDDELLLPNLYNVATAYRQRCWVCLQHLRHAGTGSWPELAEAVCEHVFRAAFNRSADEHEGNSYWARMRDVDPRVASVAAWEEATRVDPWFALDVAWRPAGTTARAELLGMLDHVAAAPPEKPTALDVVATILPRSRR